MTKRLASLVLVLVLGASALAGMPLHSSEQECSMGGMAGEMDCCAMAHASADTADALAARLCCAVNCPQQGTTVPSGSLQRTPALSIIAPHPATIQPHPAIPPLSSYFSPATDYPLNSQPTYIRHLALLI